MPSIRIAVNGVLGKMGSTVLGAVEADPDLTPVGGVDPRAASATVDLPGGTGHVPVYTDVLACLDATKPDVIVDFTNRDGALACARAAVAKSVRVVSGSTGLSPADYDELRKLADSKSVGVISSTNFALGAVLLMHLASIASKYFDYADVIESHHEQKPDAPSGTALSIVQAMAAARDSPFRQTVTDKQTLPGTRGGDFKGINVHSARMPGRVARHEVVFGALGQTLTMIHDSTSRDSFMPGVMFAVKRVMAENGLVIGLDAVLGLKQKP